MLGLPYWDWRGIRRPVRLGLPYGDWRGIKGPGGSGGDICSGDCEVSYDECGASGVTFMPNADCPGVTSVPPVDAPPGPADCPPTFEP